MSIKSLLSFSVSSVHKKEVGRTSLLPFFALRLLLPVVLVTPNSDLGVLKPIAASAPTQSTGNPQKDLSKISVDYSRAAGAFPRLYQYVSTIQTSNGPIDDRLIRNLGMRLERTFWPPAFWAKAGLGKYQWHGTNGNTYGDDTVLDNIVAQGAQPVVNIGGVPGWLANRDGLPSDLTIYKQLLEDGLRHLRSKYPNLQYIESLNEPDCARLSQQTVDSLYQTLAGATQIVNSSIAPGQLPFKLGGPTICHLSWGMLPDFLSFVRDNNLPLDFVSYHIYGNVDPGIVEEAREVKKDLSTAGLNSNLPQMVTEWGYNYKPSGASANVANMKQATYIAQGWYSLLANDLGDLVISMPFAENDYANVNRSVLVDSRQNSTDGSVNPLYNVYAMMNMQKNTMVAVDGLTGDLSLSPIATEDRSGVALMLTNTNGGNVIVSMNNLPMAFHNGEFRFQEYLVDPTHSNFAYNQSNRGALQIVRNSPQPAASSFNMTIQMARYSVVLIVLTPSG
jgi:hypothetical protein